MKKKKTPAHKSAKARAEHYKELFETASKELKFKNMCTEHLYNVLDEIRTVDDKLCGLIAENGINRHNLDKVIHAKTLFKVEEL